MRCISRGQFVDILTSEDIAILTDPGRKMMIVPTIFLVIIIPCATSLSFNFTNFTPNNHDIIYNSSATSANDVIQLTPNQRDADGFYSRGRATYGALLPLWERDSGNLTDFSTNFSFVINSLNETQYADGFAFFLAASRVPPGNVTLGSNLGLTNDSQGNNSIDNPFFAIEFDIFQNELDPPYNHVGIDINSIVSNTTVQWLTGDSIREGRIHEATIRYNSNSRNLSISFTGFSNGSYVSQSLSYEVDFRQLLPESVYIGFTGATGFYRALHNINSWSFSSNLELPNNRTDPGIITPGGPGVGSGAKTSELAIGLGVGGAVLVIVLGLTGYGCWRKRRGKIDEDDDAFDDELGEEFEQGTGPRKFIYDELARATSNFSEQEKLGEGGFGGVYKGFLRDIDSYIAVKRVSKGSSQGVKEYASEVKIISRLRHKNLVQLLGWCHQKQELLLVYEFMPNESLDHHLFKGKSLLDWGTRFKIAQGLAYALSYLHEDWEQCVVHRDIKSSNVMLDANFNAKLGDFGLARLVDHEKGSQTTVLAGTMGYMAPECMITGKASKETDVFSFGVVALEIATGRKPINPKAEKGQVHLVEWVWQLYGMGKLVDVADPNLDNEFDSQEMEQLMIVGLWCAHPDSAVRPSIRQAIKVLNFEAPLPQLPLRMPVPMYSAPTTDMLSSTYGSIVTGSSYAYSENTSSKFTASSQESTSSALLYSS